MEKCNFRDTLDEIVVSIKSDYNRGTRKLVSLLELSQDLWDTKIEPVLKQEHLQFLGYKLEVVIECIGRINDNLKRSHGSIKSPIPSLARRWT
jgi:hypothetical protein